MSQIAALVSVLGTVLLPGGPACDHKSRCRLRSIMFGVIPFTPEADVQNCRVSGHVRNSPIEQSRRWRELRRDAVSEAHAAIQRQKELHLASTSVYLRNCCCP